MALLKQIRFVAIWLAAMRMVCAQPAAQDEYRIKAAFVYNFAKFVEWPAGSFKNPGDPIAICVMGNPFGDELESTVRGKQVDDRRLIVREVTSVAETSGCHILFVAADARRLADVLDRVKKVPVLTVGESASFSADGGVIRFKLEHDKVRLEINTCAADRAGLRISSKLLSLAVIVKGEKK